MGVKARKPKHNVYYCPKCGSDRLYVTDTRDRGYPNRRRTCEACGESFRTIEMSLDEYSKMVEVIESYKIFKTRIEREIEEWL